MNENELARRQERAQTETFIVAKTDEGFRICSPLAPANQFVVRPDGDILRCTCPDYQHHADDPEWRCKHILAVENYQAMQNHHGGGNGSAGNPVPTATSLGPTDPPKPKKGSPSARNGDATMLIKRSISPDGRIDSLSVEFSCPVGKTTTEEIKQCAEKSLKLQTEIIGGFLKDNRRGNGQVNSPPNDGAVAAQLLGIGGMNGKWGRRLFLNVLVNGQTTAKLFGTQQEIGDAIAAAGFPQPAANVAEGLLFNLPCRVITRQNGKYLDIERVLPAGG